MRVPMIATKDMTYATRRLRADDDFEASRNDARVLTALGRARLKTGDDQAKRADDMATLRAEYENVLGKRPFNGWDADTLRQKIAAGSSDG